MVIVQVCVGSSCHLKGSREIVELLERAIEEKGIGDDVVLTGSFCIGRCNRIGVTVQVNDDVYTGITVEGFSDFFRTAILPLVENERK